VIKSIGFRALHRGIIARINYNVRGVAGEGGQRVLEDGGENALHGPVGETEAWKRRRKKKGIKISGGGTEIANILMGYAPAAVGGNLKRRQKEEEKTQPI